MWGLATTREGEMWTLIGRATLAQVGEDAEIVKRIGLSESHVGLFAAGRDLVFQVMNLHPPDYALTAGSPGGATRRPWSGMRTRDLPFTRGAVAALNLVSCGSSAGAVIPCWFPDTAAITLTDRSGASREIPLDGLPVVAPELLLASDNPRRPVRDAFVTAGNMVWVLGSGEPPGGDTSTRPGGGCWRGTTSRGGCSAASSCPNPRESSSVRARTRACSSRGTGALSRCDCDSRFLPPIFSGRLAAGGMDGDRVWRQRSAGRRYALAESGRRRFRVRQRPAAADVFGVERLRGSGWTRLLRSFAGRRTIPPAHRDRQSRRINASGAGGMGCRRSDCRRARTRRTRARLPSTGRACSCVRNCVGWWAGPAQDGSGRVGGQWCC